MKKKLSQRTRSDFSAALRTTFNACDFIKNNIQILLTDENNLILDSDASYHNHILLMQLEEKLLRSIPFTAPVGESYYLLLILQVKALDTILPTLQLQADTLEEFGKQNRNKNTSKLTMKSNPKHTIELLILLSNIPFFPGFYDGEGGIYCNM
eukprot:snap_masked-scaffold_3-processed-gene-12.38-mRNA-1 protein AED:1.00 eAED:1.00 QI:0/0/0/0/1/1/2/0/152